VAQVCRAAVEFDGQFGVFGGAFAEVIGSGQLVRGFNVSVVVDASSEPYDGLLWVDVNTIDLSFVEEYSCRTSNQAVKKEYKE